MVGKYRDLLIIICVILLCGCSRVIYVPHGQAVRLRKTIEDVPIWVQTEDNKNVAGKMDLPEGWYCLPLDE